MDATIASINSSSWIGFRESFNSTSMTSSGTSSPKNCTHEPIGSKTMPPMEPCLRSGSQAPSVNKNQVEWSASSIIKGFPSKILCYKKLKVRCIDSPRGRFLAGPVHSFPSALTAELATRPNVYPSKKIMRPRSLSASFALIASESRKPWSCAWSSSLRLRVWPTRTRPF